MGPSKGARRASAKATRLEKREPESRERMGPRSCGYQVAEGL